MPDKRSSPSPREVRRRPARARAAAPTPPRRSRSRRAASSSTPSSSRAPPARPDWFSAAIASSTASHSSRGATVGHREQVVRPVRIGRPLVAVRDAAERGHRPAHVVDPLVLAPSTRPCRCGRTRRSGGRAPRRSAASGRSPGTARPAPAAPARCSRPAGRARRTARARCAGRPAARAPRRSRPRSIASGGGAGSDRLALLPLGGRVAPALHVQVDADLEEAQRRQRPDHVHLGQLAQQLDRPVEAELRRRRHAHREPDVELVLAPVVVRDAGVGVDHLGRGVGPLGRGARGHQRGDVAQPARVEDRRDLADDALAAQPRRPAPAPRPRTSRAARRAPRRAARPAGTRSGSDHTDACRRSSIEMKDTLGR